MGFSSFFPARTVSVRLSFDGTSVWPPPPAPLPRGSAGCGGRLGCPPSRRWRLGRREKAGGLSGNSRPLLPRRAQLLAVGVHPQLLGPFAGHGFLAAEILHQ